MRVIDSHTGGEPTRMIVSGGPDLGKGSVAQRAERLQNEHENIYSALLCEPRGQPAMVGAFLVPPASADSTTGAIFFNAAGNLGMCGHATIGLIATLFFMGKIKPGRHLVETPVGIVDTMLHADGNTVALNNVESYRHLKAVTIDVPDIGPVTGDVAWGGNWFFLTKDVSVPLEPSKIPLLLEMAYKIKRTLQIANVTGENGALIDHIELYGPAHSSEAYERNFVLCPDGAFDRSPCGTGSSAKLACLVADGQDWRGQEWVFESIIGSRFSGAVDRLSGRGIIPVITGQAFVHAQTELIFNSHDPYAGGIAGAQQNQIMQVGSKK
ncbi:MAG: hydroxyproline-2-epimerase [Robiginitomaculum sp.]|nr:MAG: hydroxyproline-2-epimerase [Robiginitomaculum sp.]